MDSVQFPDLNTKHLANRVDSLQFTPEHQNSHSDAGSESEHDWWHVLEHISPVGIFRTTATGQGLYVNQRWCEITGLSAIEARNDGWLQAVYPDDRDRVISEWHQAVTQSLPFQSQYRFQRADGEVTWVLGQAVAQYDSQGQLMGYIGSITDITQRKAAEEALEQHAERERLIGAIAQDIRRSLNLSQVLATTVGGVRQFLQTDRVLIFRFESDWSGTVLVESVGAGWKAIQDTVINDPCFAEAYVLKYQGGQTQATTDIHAELPSCYINMLVGFQVKASLIVPILQEDQLWGLLIAHHCSETRHWQTWETDSLKQLAGQVSIAIQQSELHQEVQRLNAELEQQVQTRTAQLQLAFDFEATLKRITDRVRDSLDEDQILQTAVRELASAIGVRNCNAALYNLEQRTSTVRYEHTTSLAPIQGRVVWMDNFEEGYRQLLQGQYFQFCSLIPHPNRGQVTLFACPILDDQGILGDLWLISHCDHVFTEQDIRLVQQVANQCAIALRQARLYQEAQAQVKELEKLNHLKDDFLSTVSHELRSPMANIKLATQMLEIILKRANLLETDADPLSKYFQILRYECQREIKLINDLLDLSRLESNTAPLDLEVINLQDWLLECAEPFIERAQNQQQSLEIGLPADLPPLTTDRSYLERIIAELLNNACKYTPAKGQITVSVAVAANRVRFQVSNLGTEIAPSDLTRVFDKFYRIPNNDPWKYGGTGLGLALAKKLSETLGGSIQVTSQAGLTSFTVELPLNPGV